MSTPNIPAASEQKTKEPPKPSNRVYCRWEVSDDALKAMFEKVGKVTEARVVRGPRLKAFGFVTFETEAEAAKAIEQMNGKALTSPMTVEFAASERGPRKRAPRQPAQPQSQGVAAAAGQPQPRGGRQRAQPTQEGAAVPGAAAAALGARRRRRRNRHAAEKKDPNWGKVVILNPDPISNPIPKETPITELQAGPREYRPGVSQGKMVSSLILNADPTKGPFNCDFKLGDFELKLLGVKVTARQGDVKIGARILYPAANRSREVYLRVRSTGENRHKFFELVKPGTDLAQPAEVFFVGLDSILLDQNSGLWKKIVLSLVSAVVPPRPPRVGLAPRATPGPAATAPSTR